MTSPRLPKVTIICKDGIEIKNVKPNVTKQSVVMDRLIEDFTDGSDVVNIPLVEPYITSDVMKFLIMIINNIDRLDVRKNYVASCMKKPYTFLANCIQAAAFLDMQNILKGLIYVLTLEMRKYHTVEELSRAFSRDTILLVGCEVAAAGGEAAGGETHVCC